MAEVVAIVVAYAEASRQTTIELEVEPGTTVAEAIERSQIYRVHPGIASDAPVGIFGTLVKRETRVSAGDRIELYRPLPEDPKERRRALAREGRTMGSRTR